ncbi:unnamed protein product [Paramecium sonneborni]|uniref:non-specific serine/threonine protein kinase n=1 Tax=Paramecium sonneborni TaxID=65129 RepID=A0A8S1MLI2_9CILI|nr:unnamed protein product [Paramecium sonneborni]
MQKNYDIREIDDYEIHFKSLIGQGAHGKVYEGRKISENRIICVKVFYITEEKKEKIKREVAILEEMKKVTHQNIVKIYHVEEQNQRIYIFMEKCIENLEQKLQKIKKENKSFSVREILEISRQICRGYNEMRKKKIIHRDLKPENIVIGDDGQYKICDYGLSKTQFDLESIQKQTQVGTPLFVAPQIFEGKYSNKADIFSFGMMIYYITFQTSLFRVKSLNDIQEEYQKLQNGIIIPEISNQDDKKLSDELKSILQMTITYLEEDRIGWDQLTSILEDLDLKPQINTFTTKKNEQNEFGMQSSNHDYYNLPKVKKQTPDIIQYPYAMNQQIKEEVDNQQSIYFREEFENDNKNNNLNIQYQFKTNKQNQQDNNQQNQIIQQQSYQKQSNANFQDYQPDNYVKTFDDIDQDFKHEQDQKRIQDKNQNSQSQLGQQNVYDKIQQQQVQDFQYEKQNNSQYKVNQQKFLIQESINDLSISFHPQEFQKQTYIQNNNRIYQNRNQEEENQILYQNKQFKNKSTNQIINNVSLVESQTDLNLNSRKNIQKSQLTNNQKIYDQSQNNIQQKSSDRISYKNQQECLKNSIQQFKPDLEESSIQQNPDETQTINFSNFMEESQINMSKTNFQEIQTPEKSFNEMINLKNKNLIQNNQQYYPSKQDEQKEQIFNQQKIAQNQQKDSIQPVIQQSFQNLTKKEFYPQNQQVIIKKNQNQNNSSEFKNQEYKFNDNQKLIKQYEEEKLTNNDFQCVQNNMQQKRKLIKITEITQSSFDLKKIVLIIFAKIRFAENVFNSYQKLKTNQQLEKYQTLFEIFNYLLRQYQYSMIANIRLICMNDQNMNQSKLKKQLCLQIEGNKILDYQEQNQTQLKEINKIYCQKIEISAQASQELQNLFDKRINNSDLMELIRFVEKGDLFSYDSFIELYENYFQKIFQQVNKDSNFKVFLKQVLFQKERFIGFSIKFIKIDEEYPINNYKEIDIQMIDYLTDDEQLLQEYIKSYQMMRLKK